jgi:hypothetical protein
LLPIPLAALHQARPLLAQFLLHAFGYFQQVVAHRHRAELLVHWQHLMQQIATDLIGQQPTPLHFQVQHFRTGVLGKDSLERAEGLFHMRRAPAVFQPRALQLDVPKQRANGNVVMTLAVARFTAFRAVAPPQQSIVDLLLDHALLDSL